MASDAILTQASGHTDFSESTEEIAPLTEEEKKARLEELREKAKEKRNAQSIQAREEAKKNEVGGQPRQQRAVHHVVLC